MACRSWVWRGRTRLVKARIEAKDRARHRLVPARLGMSVRVGAWSGKALAGPSMAVQGLAWFVVAGLGSGVVVGTWLG
jgi:hypothetical protein